MPKITLKIVEKQVWQALSQVKDPELGIDIVSLGLIYNVKVAPQPGKKSYLVWITMTLTTPGCPLFGAIQLMVKEAIASLEMVGDEDNVSVEITFDPPWTVELLSPAARAELNVTF